MTVNVHWRWFFLRSSSSSSGSMTYYYEDQGDTRFIFLRGRENPRTHQIKSFESVLRVKQQKSAMGKNLLIKKQTSKFHTNGIQGQQTIWENSALKKFSFFSFGIVPRVAFGRRRKTLTGVWLFHSVKTHNLINCFGPIGGCGVQKFVFISAQTCGKEKCVAINVMK